MNEEAFLLELTLSGSDARYDVSLTLDQARKLTTDLFMKLLSLAALERRRKAEGA